MFPVSETNNQKPGDALMFFGYLLGLRSIDFQVLIHARLATSRRMEESNRRLQPAKLNELFPKLFVRCHVTIRWGLPVGKAALLLMKGRKKTRQQGQSTDDMCFNRQTKVVRFDAAKYRCRPNLVCDPRRT